MGSACSARGGTSWLGRHDPPIGEWVQPPWRVATRLKSQPPRCRLKNGLGLLGARRGGLELTGERIRQAAARADAVTRRYPHIQAASWSIQPTSWLDSFHERLGEIAPGVAHDGQFYLADMLWPDTPNVLLAEVDHAQPAMGGFGFDPVLFWRGLVAVALAQPGAL